MQRNKELQEYNTIFCDIPQKYFMFSGTWKTE